MTLKVEIQHSFPDFNLDVSFVAPRGVTAVVGQSGAGKSTVVNAIAGISRPGHGRIELNNRVLFDRCAGVNVPPHHRGIGTVFQDSRLFPHFSVRGNLEFSRRFRRANREPIPFGEIVDLFGLAPLLSRRPGGLSGGEQQRISIARSLLSAPELLILDEPLSSLDTPMKTDVLPYIERLRDVIGIPIVYVSHSVQEVARLANRVVVLEAGKMVVAGEASQVMSDPAMISVFGVRDVGSTVSGHVLRHGSDGLTCIGMSPGWELLIPGIDAQVGEMVRLRIAAQDVILSLEPIRKHSALNVVQGRVVRVTEGRGPGVLAQIEVGNQRILARMTARSAREIALKTGQICYAIINAISIAPVDIGIVSGDVPLTGFN